MTTKNLKARVAKLVAALPAPHDPEQARRNELARRVLDIMPSAVVNAIRAWQAAGKPEPAPPEFLRYFATVRVVSMLPENIVGELVQGVHMHQYCALGDRCGWDITMPMGSLGLPPATQALIQNTARDWLQGAIKR
jgi:hypothetical protein